MTQPRPRGSPAPEAGAPSGRPGSIYGRITDDLGRIACGGTATTCLASHDAGTVVTLTATAAPGAEFVGWGGDDCTGAGAVASVTVTLDVGRSCSATFQPRAGATATMSVTMGLWIGRVYEQRDFGFEPRLDCGGDAVLSPPVCSLTLPSSGWIMLRASPEAGAPAGAIRWTCTSDDLGVPPSQPTVSYTGVLTPNLYLTRDKTCRAELDLSPP